MKPTTTVSQRRSKKRKKTGVSPPDLTAIGYAFSDAQALVSVAYKVIAAADYSQEGYVLRLGVESLERVLDQLDEAEHQLARFLKSKDLASDTP